MVDVVQNETMKTQYSENQGLHLLKHQEKIMDSANGAREPVILAPSHPLSAMFGRARDQIFERMRF